MVASPMRTCPVAGMTQLKNMGMILFESTWHRALVDQYHAVTALPMPSVKKNYPAILKLSAEIGHYMADAHVPLHANSNYNGQQTGQHGIHGLWESRDT